jgi:hypothetical protein
MIESTAAYRIGRKCNGWINGYSEEYAIKQKDSKSGYTGFTSYDDPFYSRFVSRFFLLQGAFYIVFMLIEFCTLHELKEQSV